MKKEYTSKIMTEVSIATTEEVAKRVKEDMTRQIEREANIQYLSSQAQVLDLYEKNLKLQILDIINSENSSYSHQERLNEIEKLCKLT